MSTFYEGQYVVVLSGCMLGDMSAYVGVVEFVKEGTVYVSIADDVVKPVPVNEVFAVMNGAFVAVSTDPTTNQSSAPGALCQQKGSDEQ
jgi:hypothetical protein